MLPAERAEHDNFAIFSHFFLYRVAVHCSNTELRFRRLDAGFEVRSARSPSSSDSLSVPSMGRLDGNILLTKREFNDLRHTINTFAHARWCQSTRVNTFWGGT